MKEKGRKENKKGKLIELLVTEDGRLLIANAGSAEMALIQDISRRRPSRGSFYCG